MRVRKLLYAIPLLTYFVLGYGASLGPDGQARRIIFKNNTNDNIHVSYQPQRGDPSIRRVLAPRTVLMIRGNIGHILWNSEGAFLAGKTNPLSFAPAPYVLIKFENGKASINGCNQLQTCGGAELRSRGVSDLFSVFPALETRQKLASWLLTPLRRLVYGFSTYPEIEALIKSKGLDQHVAARYILGLPEYPSREEINHATTEYQEDLLLTGQQLIPGFSGAIPKEIKYTLNESQHLLSEQAKEKGYSEKVQATISETTFTFKNQATKPVYLAAYFVEETDTAKIAPNTLTVIAPGEQKAFTTPGISGNRITTGARRRILATFDRNQLKDYLNEAEYLGLPNVDVDVSYQILPYPTLIYLMQDKLGALRVLTTFEYGKVIEGFHDLSQAIENIEAGQERGAVMDRNHFLRVDRKFIRRRMPIIKRAFENLIGIRNIPDNNVPRVGLALTGGGYRAMTEALGYITAASELNVAGNSAILDFVSYIAGLSGSTWALSAILDAKFQTPPQSFSYRGVANLIQQRVAQNIMSMKPNEEDQRLLGHLYDIKKAFRMPSDHWIHMWYGFVLAKTLLSGYDEKTRQMRRLSDYAQTVLNGTMPLPIMTAVSVYPRTREKVTTFEFSPLLVGTHQHGSKWVDTKLFGRNFDGDQAILTLGMEEYLSYLMAIWGSAYAASLKQVRDSFPTIPILSSIPQYTPEWLNKWLATALDARLPRPKEFNFTYNLQNAIGDNREVIHLVDGAHNSLAYDGKQIINNFAAVPLLYRNVDLLILGDCTNAVSADHFVAAALRARELGLPFPNVDLRRAVIEITSNMRANQPTLIVDDNNLNAPVIIVLATMKDATYKDPNFDPTQVTFTGTFNFQYQPHEFAQLRGLSEHSMRKAVPVIKRALELAYARRQQRIGGPPPGPPPAQAS